MPTFADAVPKGYEPTEECQECFDEAFDKQRRQYADAYASTHHTSKESFGPFSWTSHDNDDAGYEKLKKDADDNYESALRACMRKHKPV